MVSSRSNPLELGGSDIKCMKAKLNGRKTGAIYLFQMNYTGRSKRSHPFTGDMYVNPFMAHNTDPKASLLSDRDERYPTHRERRTRCQKDGQGPCRRRR